MRNKIEIGLTCNLSPNAHYLTWDGRKFLITNIQWWPDGRTDVWAEERDINEHD